MTSLAHEINSGLDPTYRGKPARALADEFGLDLNDREIGVGSQYGNNAGEDDYASDDEGGEYMIDHQGIDNLIDRLDSHLDLDLADPFDLDSSSLPVPGQSLGDELAYGAFNTCPSDHPTSLLLDEFNLGTNDRNEIDIKGHLTPQDSFGDSIYPFHEPSSPCSPISSSSSSLDSTNYTSSSSSSSLSTLLSHILLPPSFLPLLRKDDQSFLLESASKSLALKIEASARQREGMNVEWNAFSRDERNRFTDGLGYRLDESFSPIEESNVYIESSSLTLDGLPSSSFSSEGSLSPVVHRMILSPVQSPPTPTQPTSHVADPLILRDSSSPLSSPSQSSPSFSSYTQSIIRRVEELRFLTDSLISSLSAVGDTSQITLSGATEAGRRLRSIRTTLGGIKSEEASWERSKEEIQSWEEQEEKRVNLKAVMRTELDGFRKAMEDFETKSITIRTTHENFLRGIYV